MSNASVRSSVTKNVIDPDPAFMSRSFVTLIIAVSVEYRLPSVVWLEIGQTLGRQVRIEKGFFMVRSDLNSFENRNDFMERTLVASVRRLEIDTERT